MTKRFLTGAAAGALIAGAAHADVTASQVWQDWVAALEGADATYTAESIDESDEQVTVTGLELVSEFEGGSYQVEIDRVVLDTNADGTVTVTTSPRYPIVVEGTDEEGQSTSATLQVSHPDLVMTVSGDEVNRRHAYDAPEITIELVEATQNGEPADLSLSATLTDTSGSYAVSEDETSRFDSTLAAAGARLSVAGTDPSNDGTFALAFEMSDLAADNVTSFLDADITDMASALRDGFGTEGSFSYGPTTYSVSGTNADGQFGVQGAAESGSLMVDLSADGLTYGARNVGQSLTMSGDQVPLPEVTFEIAESEVSVTMPVLPSDEPQPFDAVLRMVDLTVGEDVWGMFDPAGVLPRDPATLVIDVDGTASVSEDLLAEGATMEGPPGDIESLSIDELRLSLLGADLTGTGELKFSAPGGMAVMPQPVGQIGLRLEGANELIDRLVQMGLIPQDQAMSARMMLGMFAQPGEGEDTLNSTFEFTEDGGIIANGQRLR